MVKNQEFFANLPKSHLQASGQAAAKKLQLPTLAVMMSSDSRH